MCMLAYAYESMLNHFTRLFSDIVLYADGIDYTLGYKNQPNFYITTNNMVMYKNTTSTVVASFLNSSE